MKKLLTLIIAVVVVLVGGSAFYLKVLEHPDKKLTIAPQLSPTSLGLTAIGHF